MVRKMVKAGLLVIGAVFFLFGAVMLIRQLKMKRKNTESVTGKAVSYVEEVSQDADPAGTRSYIYYPVIQYTISGKTFELKSDIGTGKKKYEIGAPVEILCDPNKPENFIIAGDNSAYIMAVISIIIGIGLCVFAILINNDT